MSMTISTFINSFDELLYGIALFLCDFESNSRTIIKRPVYPLQGYTGHFYYFFLESERGAAFLPFAGIRLPTGLGGAFMIPCLGGTARIRHLGPEPIKSSR